VWCLWITSMLLMMVNLIGYGYDKGACG
jgi:hypothetical protein